ncbi:MAG: class I SAM-dependent methyltransferase [Bacteroidota bacterium]|nr:16S rRNA (cytosine(1402)-N(4))-methyltransferase [Candidatus Kapabacteria bacterium]MCS7302599.1 16S rRNA (cytosine(1402)-N(4))-methyltransferase [Candidatus Kapabacteria bacterium]MCX7936467.1 16S rRNA (cytosine(1402)-N(4))-methyltransferase [Chlorobiota bacterium]MDW8074252.1 class I SAM-dependent methyltransferase [Bacteroidota bacterium]MDW8271272.1 class I SAM-dependent methyltransferase [Bacteroidota bacterium]
MVLPTIVEWSHWIVRRVLQAGDVAFDATVGHGHDLVMMAQQVGPTGLVLGCDIQEHALESARHHALAQGVNERVRLFLDSHEHIDRICAAAGVHTLRAIMYNLGYLPGGDKSIRTRIETTIPSLGRALGLLAEGGVMTIVSYRGHEGGAEEAAAVLAWCHALPPHQYECVEYTSLLSDVAPIGIAVARRTTL